MTNREAHEQAAGMGLEESFFRFNGIDPEGEYKPLGSLNTKQPNPVNPKGPEIFSLVIADLKERDAIGRRAYGVDLHAVDGRDHLVDAYQECLDMAVYLRQEIEERVILRKFLIALRDGIDDGNMHCDPLPPMSSWRYVVDVALGDKL